MQALGNVLAVPFEKEDGRSMVVFYDVSNPLQPTRLSNVVEHTPLSDQAGTATLGKLADGRFLDLVGDGSLHNIPDLNSVGFGDTASCAEWRGGPFARAGADRTAECSGATTPVPLDGSASITFNRG